MRDTLAVPAMIANLGNHASRRLLEVLRWIAAGERGSSSRSLLICIWYAIHGERRQNSTAHPQHVRGGPMVRILLPPPASQERTVGAQLARDDRAEFQHPARLSAPHLVQSPCKDIDGRLCPCSRLPWFVCVPQLAIEWRTRLRSVPRSDPPPGAGWRSFCFEGTYDG